MHRVGAEQAIEVARCYAFDRGLDGSDGLGQPALGIFSEEQAIGATGGSFKRRLDRMQTEQRSGPSSLVMTAAWVPRRAELACDDAPCRAPEKPAGRFLSRHGFLMRSFVRISLGL